MNSIVIFAVGLFVTLLVTIYVYLMFKVGAVGE